MKSHASYDGLLRAESEGSAVADELSAAEGVRAVDQLDFFNCSGPESRPETTGRLLPRFPQPVRQALSHRGRFVGMDSTGVEIRFVTPAPDVRVTLSAIDANASIVVYRGDFEHSRHDLPRAGAVTLHLDGDTAAGLGLVHPDRLVGGDFAPDVWRLVVHRGTVCVHGVDTFGEKIRRPERSQLPRVRWLAYGSSITNANASGYPHQAARWLGVDVLNKGMSGSCRIEPELCDYLATLDWEIATCELGVNLRDIDPQEFRRRVTYLLDRFEAMAPGRPVGLISPFPNRFIYPHPDVPTDVPDPQRAFADVLESLADERTRQRVFFIDGEGLLDRFAGMHRDLVHPDEFGQVRIGINLAQRLKPHIDRLVSAGVD